MTVDSNNISNPPLIERGKIILSLLHIKLRLMKQFAKALNHDGPCFIYITENTWPKYEKTESWFFDGPQLRQLINHPDFIGIMNEVKSNAWSSFVLVVKIFLGNHKAPNYKLLVENMLVNFKNFSCNMSIKVHFLHSHLD